MDHSTSDSRCWGCNLISGTMIGTQSVAFGVATCIARRYAIGREHKAIYLCGAISIIGFVIFLAGALSPVPPRVAIALLLLGRLIQGLGAGVDFTTKHVLTQSCDADNLTIYNSYWSMAGAWGTGTGPMLVWLSSFLGQASSDIGMSVFWPILMLVGFQSSFLVFQWACTDQFDNRAQKA